MFLDGVTIPVSTDLFGQALVAAAVSVAGVCILGAGLFVAYAARIFRSYKEAEK